MQADVQAEPSDAASSAAGKKSIRTVKPLSKKKLEKYLATAENRGA